jgi:integrase
MKSVFPCVAARWLRFPWFSSETAHIVCMHTGASTMRQKISKSTIDRLKPGKILTDTNPVGFVARCLPSGAVTYGFRYRDKRTGRQHWIGLGVHGDVTADQARTKALQLAKEVRDQKQPISAREEAAKKRAAAGGTVNSVLDVFLDRYARPNLRSAAEIERCFAVYVRPRIGSKPIYSLRRGDIVEMLDRIEDENGPVQADRVLAHVRKCFNWTAARDDAFTPPIVKGMARTKPLERARSRALDDQEIRDLWTALDTLDGKAPACFAPFVRTLFLTATRLRMVSDMTHDEIAGRDWTVPGARNKGGREHLVPLTDTVAALIGTKRKGFVFSSDGGETAFKGFSKAKAALDRRLAELRKAAGRKPMPHFTFHDLRRTSRSLMSRAGVPPDHAERVLGHTIVGVRKTYDRHEYRSEKFDALERLGALVERILHPTEKVVGFPKSARGSRKAT